MLQFVKYYEADQAIRTRLRKIPLVNFDTQEIYSQRLILLAQLLNELLF